MNKQQFKRLFNQVLSEAAQKAEDQFEIKLPRQYKIHLHGAGYAAASMDANQAVDILYLSPNQFYRIIDIGIIGATEKWTDVFVRVSGHTPASFEKTWNPDQYGPFKVIESSSMSILEDLQADTPPQVDRKQLHA